MTSNSPGFDSLLSVPRSSYGAQALSQLQADLVSTARRWAVDEVGVAMAHQLSEPLTALLLYLQGIKKEWKCSGDAEAGANSTRVLVELALCETERVCNIIKRMGYAFEAPLDTESALARGRDAIGSLAKEQPYDGHVGAPAARPGPEQCFLTPRECEVLALITDGASNKEGAYRLEISKRTFEAHRARIMKKVGARNAADLVRLALSKSTP
jgi:DNA-binding CsgD family transcriptional regulator